MTMPTQPVTHIGVGFDTARYGHHVSFLRDDRQPAAKAFSFTENQQGYQQVRAALEGLQQRHGQVHFDIRIDAAGQYAANLEHFLRSLPFPLTVSLGQPKQNKDYRSVHFPKRKADAVESLACARFAVVERPAASPPLAPAFAHLAEVASCLRSCVKQTTRLVNQLHNHLARTFPELATIAPRVSAAWLLELLSRFPTAEKIAAAPLSALTAIPHLDEDLGQRLQEAARSSIASQSGLVMEELIRQSAQAVQHNKRLEAHWTALLEKAYDALPPSNHALIETIGGIGKKTAAALVVKIIDIDRFATANQLVGYFGIFPEEDTSGVDKYGKPIAPGTQRMSRKGNDLARGCLWFAAMSAIVHNPTIRRLYARKRAQGKRGDVALGHCMRKLLQLVFAVWKSGKPYVAPPECEGSAGDPEKMALADGAGANQAQAVDTANQAVGRTEASSERPAVTTATAMVGSAAPANNGQTPPAPSAAAPTAAAPTAPHYQVNFAELRRQISIEQVLREAQWLDCLHAKGRQLRGPCPIHSAKQSRGRSFSVNLHKNAFQCFDASCGAKGNALDLWAQIRKLPLHEAAKELVERLGLQPRNNSCTSTGDQQAPSTGQRRGTR